MAYDRYDSRDQNRGYRDERQRDQRGGQDERGFFDRAIDSVSNFFSDDDDRQRGEHQRSGSGNQHRGGYEPQAYDQNEGRRAQEREQSRFGYSDRSTSYGGGQSTSYARGRDEGDYKNQYGRGGGESGGFGRGDYGHQGDDHYSRQGQDHGSLGQGRDQDRSRSYPSGYGQTGGGSYRETQQQSFGSNRSHQDSDQQSGRYQAQGSDRYRPMTGDYGRGSSERGRMGSGMGGQNFSSEQYGRQDFSQDQESDRTYNYGGWGDRDSQRQSQGQGQSQSRSGFMGAAAGTGMSGSRSPHDQHYSSWRQRQIEELDRDYDEYCREHQSRFENEFGGFRQQRQTKRQMLQSIRPHMDVVDESGQHVGTVDKVRGEKVILTRNDPEAGGVHRSFSCSLLERVEGNQITLSGSKDTIRSRLTVEDDGDRSQDRSQSGGGIMGALFGSEGNDREEQRSSTSSATSQSTTSQSGDGPHILDRSFSGTYEDDSKK